jgi:hypothetical protein
MDSKLAGEQPPQQIEGSLALGSNKRSMVSAGLWSPNGFDDMMDAFLV